MIAIHSISEPRPLRAADFCPRGHTITIATLILSLASAFVRAEPSLDVVLQDQSKRIAMIERVAPSVVALFDSTQRGGGSGVIIDSEGYGLTNYHVVAGMLNTRRGLGGISDGSLYDLEVLGIDPTGDVAMFRLLGRDSFPYARLGDSDAVQVGDTAIAMGNPFSLSEDYSPTVTMGIVTGTHRYQMGVRGNLAYSDCIQTDAPINPGNSGGPLFNAAGEIIGINGRISVNTRGRFNVGFGYAITSNQIRRFIPALRAGLLARHGTLQATVDDREGNGPVFTNILPEASAHDAGVHHGDKLLTLDGVAITTPNHFASVLGTYPADWLVPIELNRRGGHIETIARLDPVEPEMRVPFEVDRDANLRQVKRVLRAYQEGVANVEKSKSQNVEMAERKNPYRWTCTLVREHEAIDDQGMQRSGGRTERYRVSHDGDGPIRLQRVREDGLPGDEIQYDDTAVTRTPKSQKVEESKNPGIDVSEDSGAETELTPEARLILAAMYVTQHRLFTSTDEMDLTNVTHTGGNAFVGAGRSPRIVEIIDWPIIDGGIARLWFDTQVSDLLRIEVHTSEHGDGPIATIDLSDYREIGGVRRPCTIEVHGEAYAYRDTFVDWSVGK